MQYGILKAIFSKKYRIITVESFNFFAICTCLSYISIEVGVQTLIIVKLFIILRCFMKCDICKKHEATIHIQEIVNSNKKAMHLCSECAVKKSQNDPSFDFGGFNLAEMLYNISESQGGIPGLSPMLENESPDDTDEIKDTANLKCPQCQWTLKALRQTGRVGCPECYNVFREVIQNALENMHRGKLHVGKRPGNKGTDKSSSLMLKLMNLQKELDEVIQREEYEKAAKLRDKINNLKEKMNSPKKVKKKNASK